MLAAAHSGAPWAYERIFRDLSGPVAGYLRLQGATEPDDLVSEVFLGVFGGLARFTGDEPGFRSYVFTIAHRRLVDERRRRARDQRTTKAAVAAARDLGGDVESEALDALGSRWVRDVCRDLPGDQRAVLLLRLFGDLTVEQVADVLGKSVGAVKQLQRRGVLSVRKKVEREGVPL